MVIVYILLFCILSGLQASNETEISFLNQSSSLYESANPEKTLSSQGDVAPEKIDKITDYGHPERAFFQKLETFGLGQTNWAEIL